MIGRFRPTRERDMRDMPRATTLGPTKPGYNPRVTTAIERARRAYANRRWGDACDGYADSLAHADNRGAVNVDDLESFAWAAVLAGRPAVSFDAFERWHQALVDAGNTRAAARAAFWLGLRLTSVGQRARASAWLAKAQRLVDAAGADDCVERGYLLVAAVFRANGAGNFDAARSAAAEAAAAGERFRDGELSALARNLEGRALIRSGKLVDGIRLLDEAMLAASTGTLSPVVTGLVYCSVIAGCTQCYALERAGEWTRALSEWCQAQPQLGAFSGTCLIHRSEVLQLHGSFDEALAEVGRAVQHLSSSRDPDTGNAFYQEGEIHRVRGDITRAEGSYARAREHGRDPQPGHALLRLAEGNVDVAAAAIRRALASTTTPFLRAQLLVAHVEIMLAADDVDEARRARDELDDLAQRFDMELLSAQSWYANGHVLLAAGDARRAVDPLRRAQESWERARAPYFVARARVLVARGYEALGDDDGARLERAAARKIFVELGAALDVAALDRAHAGTSRAPTYDGGLSKREREVLLHVADGKTNKEIAGVLFLSGKTVDRHVSNIFVKLNVSTRAAATAWAYRNGVVGALGRTTHRAGS
jgi:DNA-binding CsgD family transcriptional regulator/tetratricopeptide (TPR) repeat protein